MLFLCKPVYFKWPSAKYPPGGKASGPPVLRSICSVSHMDGNGNAAQGSSVISDRETYAQRASRGLSSAEEQAFLDAINNNLGEPLGPPPCRHRGAFSSFEQQHFHPLNVTPDRLCSAFFRASKEYSSKAIIDSCIAIGIPAVAVKCLQRRSSGEAMITFRRRITVISSWRNQP